MAEIELTYEQVVDIMRQLPLEIKKQLLDEFSEEVSKAKSEKD